MLKVILASASPRRRELLTQMGVAFEVLPALGEEIMTKDNPAEVVQELALRKAKEVADRLEVPGRTIEQGLKTAERQEILILGADTVVVYNGVILGKPKDEAEAVSMLSMLSGRTHSVFTGVALIYVKGDVATAHHFYEETNVTMYPLSEAEIAAYVATGEPMDKAGAYGIQGKGAIYIEKIQGDYNNVVGLPIARIYQEMKKLGIAIL